MTMTTRAIVSISSNSTSSTDARIVVVRSVRIATSIDGGQRGAQLRQQRLDAVDDGDDVRAGLALDVQDDGRRLVHPRGLLDVLGVVDDGRHVGEVDGRAVPVGDDERAVLVAREELIVGADRVRLLRAVEGALGLVDVRLRRWPCARPPSSARRRRARSGLTWTRTAGFWPPLMLTSRRRAAARSSARGACRRGPRPSRAAASSTSARASGSARRPGWSCCRSADSAGRAAGTCRRR